MKYAALFSLFAVLSLAARTDAALFDRADAERLDFGGVTAWLGRPVEVTSQISWKTTWPRENGKEESQYFHYFPLIAKFPGGHLLTVYSYQPDAVDCPVLLSAYQISTDGGAHWGRRYETLAQQPTLFLPGPSDSLLAIPFNLTERTPGDHQNFVGPTFLFQNGGSTVLLEPEGFRILDWPWPTPPRYSCQPRENWTPNLSVTGDVFRLGHRLLLTAYGAGPGMKLRPISTFLLSSEDGGHNWRYLSTVAGPEASLEGQKGYEGANESTMIELADGELMAVFRVGSGAKWHLRRTYSRDGGRTWSQPDVLPAYSVFPQLLRTANGVIGLATGRPGLFLWLSADPRGENWKKIDIVARHNECLTDATHRISRFGSGDDLKFETTGYTALVEVAPNRILYMYDRDPVIRPPERPPRGRDDLSRVYVLPIEIERK